MFNKKRLNLPLTWQEILVIAFILLTTLHFQEAKAWTLFGKGIGCTDGDTCTVLDENKVRHEIRLHGIDAPETSCHSRKQDDEGYCVEKSQPYGKASKRSVNELTFGKEVNVEIQPGNTHGREIGTIWAGNINVNLEQVRRGYAWMYHKYAKQGMTREECQEMQYAEREARENRRGLWEDHHPVPPWEYRHRQ